jgi:hypothetical protein
MTDKTLNITGASSGPAKLVAAQGTTIMKTLKPQTEETAPGRFEGKPPGHPETVRLRAQMATFANSPQCGTATSPPMLLLAGVGPKTMSS